MTDEYKLVIERKSNGKYETELTCNGKNLDFPLSESLRGAIDHIGFENIKIFVNNPSISRLETIISGEGLK